MSAYCECQFKWVHSHHILGNSRPHLPYYHHIHCRNGYEINDINNIKAISTWFLLVTFTMLSIIPLHQLLILCIFIFFINKNISFINNNIGCSHNCSCMSLRITWPISNKKLMHLDDLGLLLLSLCVFSSFSSTTISVSLTTILVTVINAAVIHSDWHDQSIIKIW